MENLNKKLITSESVTEGHPDKVCDKIADSVLDEYLRQDKNAHVACEVVATTGFVMVMGEVSANANVDVEKIVRNTVNEIGYDRDEVYFNGNNIEVLVKLDQQSPDIAMGVGDDSGAGDQGMMFGLASDETKELMPASIMYSHLLTKKLTEVRKNNVVPYLRPDGKAQVTVEYEGNKIKRIDNVVLSTQHDENVSLEELKEFIINEVIKKVIPADLIDEKTVYYINPTGRFCIGGPAGDSGLTGRKIVVDTYGGIAHHGGGAFSGKDPSKVDRSAAYMMRYIAKNIVASGLIPKIEVGVSYAIGVSEPTSIMLDTFGYQYKNPHMKDSDVVEMIRKLFPLSPKALIQYLGLRNPIYSQTTNYGHFGKENLPWEQLDKVDEIKKYYESFGK